MNVFIFGLGRVIVAYGQCRGSELIAKQVAIATDELMVVNSARS